MQAQHMQVVIASILHVNSITNTAVHIHRKGVKGGHHNSQSSSERRNTKLERHAKRVATLADEGVDWSSISLLVLLVDDAILHLLRNIVKATSVRKEERRGRGRTRHLLQRIEVLIHEKQRHDIF